MNDPWIDKLSDYLDDELAAADRAAVDAHLSGCEECRRTLDELIRVVDAARALTPRPPARNLWSGVASRLERQAQEDETPVADTVAAREATAFRRRSTRRLSFTLPQLLAASLLLAAVTAGTVWRVRAPGALPARNASLPAVADRSTATRTDAGAQDGIDPSARPPATTVSFADAQYDAAVTDLESALTKGRGRLDPSTIAIVEQNLQIIDHAIAQARQALESDPANSYLSSYLLETRRRKLELLRRATALTTESN